MAELAGHAMQADQDLAVHGQRAADAGAYVAAEGHAFEMLEVQALGVIADDHVHVAVDEHGYAESAQAFRHVHVVESGDERGLQHHGARGVDHGREAYGNRLQFIFSVQNLAEIAFQIVGEFGH